MSSTQDVDAGQARERREPLGERWIRFVQASLQAGRQVRQLLSHVGAGWHLSDAELLLLWNCSQPTVTGHTESDLAGPLGLTTSQLSAALYDLRDRGLLSFRRLPDEDSPQPIQLTPLGLAALQDITRALAPAAQLWDSQASAEELEGCIQLLLRLTAFSRSRGGRRNRPAGAVVPTPLASTTRGAA